MIDNVTSPFSIKLEVLPSLLNVVQLPHSKKVTQRGSVTLAQQTESFLHLHLYKIAAYGKPFY